MILYIVGKSVDFCTQLDSWIWLIVTPCEAEDTFGLHCERDEKRNRAMTHCEGVRTKEKLSARQLWSWPNLGKLLTVLTINFSTFLKHTSLGSSPGSHFSSLNQQEVFNKALYWHTWCWQMKAHALSLLHTHLHKRALHVWPGCFLSCL